MIPVTQAGEGCDMNKDELKGKARAAKGKVKEKAGELMDDPELQVEGAAEQAAGRVQEGFGAAKRKVSDAIEDLTDKDEA
jgi:uncharacterized protein YjbJ (UPF0337 family)